VIVSFLPTLLPALLLVPAAHSEDSVEATSPPGLIALKGGRTTIGSTVKEIEKLVVGLPEARQRVRPLDAETPQHTRDVLPFLLGVTEVTNEQYAKFVDATTHRPPLEWGEEPIDAARQAFLQKQAEENNERRERGEALVKGKFEAAEWWSKNWKESPWAVPEGSELRPVVRVNFADVLAYCLWAGVRPPTEFEYQHACRGAEKDPYPWGTDWVDGKYCASREMKQVKVSSPAGSFDEGKSRDGLFDLAGNVWEWTSSPFVAYPKFRKNKYKIEGKKEAVPEPRWDGNKRVVVGGSFGTSRIAVRCTTRRGSDRAEMTQALGFRIAASTQSGKDIANSLWISEVRASEARPGGVRYEPDAAMAMERWISAPPAEGAPEGYGVIAGYEHVAFVPVGELEESSDAGYRRLSLSEPQQLGFVSIAMPMVEPALEPGVYFIAFRASGDSRAVAEETTEEEGAQEAAGDEGEDPLEGLINFEVDNILFFDGRTGEFAGKVEIDGVSFGKPTKFVGFSPIVRQVWVQDPDDEDEQIQVPENWLKLRMELPTKVKSRVLGLDLLVKPAPEFFDAEWRK